MCGRNDYESGIELVATTDNTVMTRTFSKIHGLAALRLGWMYGPAHVVDAINRIRAPFNVNTPAMLAGIASIEDAAHIERSRAHNARWLPWLTEEIGKLGLEVTPSVANFILIHFPKTKGRTSKDADAFLTARGLILRAGRELRPARRLAADGRHRGSQSSGGCGTQRIHGEQGVSKIMFDRLALIGPGLIGSSIMRAARAQGLVKTIVATARSPQTRERVKELGIADEVTDSNAAAVKDADLVIVCIPVGASGAVAKEIGPHLKPGATVSDVGSVKGAILRDMAPHIPAGIHFIPGHPVAGTEYSGPDAGFAELFVNRWCILTPPEGADKSAVERLAAFWRAFGANVDCMSAEHHDLVLGITSHLPHLIAYTIVGTANELSQVTEFRSAAISPPAASAISPASPPPIPPCGATSSSPTRMRCWKCSAASTRTSLRSPAPCAAVTARRCSIISRARAPSVRASWRSGRIRRDRISAARIRICRKSPRRKIRRVD